MAAGRAGYRGLVCRVPAVRPAEWMLPEPVPLLSTPPLLLPPREKQEAEEEEQEEEEEDDDNDATTLSASQDSSDVGTTQPVSDSPVADTEEEGEEEEEEKEGKEERLEEVPRRTQSGGAPAGKARCHSTPVLHAHAHAHVHAQRWPSPPAAARVAATGGLISPSTPATTLSASATLPPSELGENDFSIPESVPEPGPSRVAGLADGEETETEADTERETDVDGISEASPSIADSFSEPQRRRGPTATATSVAGGAESASLSRAVPPAESNARAMQSSLTGPWPNSAEEIRDDDEDDVEEEEQTAEDRRQPRDSSNSNALRPSKAPQQLLLRPQQRQGKKRKNNTRQQSDTAGWHSARPPKRPDARQTKITQLLVRPGGS